MHVGLLAKLTLGAVVTLLTLGTVAAVGDEPSWHPPDDTITAVTGTRGSGFHVKYFGKRDAYLPTYSESVAECGEYRSLVRRVQCRVQVRTWYRDLRVTKLAIRYARLDQH